MNTIDLPERYERIKEIDLVRNRKEVIIVNVISAAIVAVMLVFGILAFGTSRFDDMLRTETFEELNDFIFKCIITVILGMASIVLHEIIHSIFMKALCKECKLKFGFRLFYIYAKSDAYYTKRSYNIIACAPLLIIGILSAIACIVLPHEWSWVFYIIEVLNVSGAAGDIYVFSIITRMPEDILISDIGTSMSVYGIG